MSEWSPLERADAPLASHVGPFPLADFVEVWWRHRGSGIPLAVEGSGAALPCVLDEGLVRIAGDADLTDYHSPLGYDMEAMVAALLAQVPAASVIAFDSLPQEAAVPLLKALTGAGATVTSAEHSATMVVDLPSDDYTAGLDGKHRHEIRRKVRRFEETFGEPGLRRDDSGFETFVEMHRAAPGDKGEFMTDAMEAFFRDLLRLPGAVLDLLVGGSGRPVAAAFGFEDDDTYYLYNSSFDPGAAAGSPGIVLCDSLIRAAVASGKGRFDFLKGTEEYKRRFGAVPRPLMAIQGTSP
jgi:CelD/BcsL family acetyltransferase involved in cellulose biosynthesis